MWSDWISQPVPPLPDDGNTVAMTTRNYEPPKLGCSRREVWGLCRWIGPEVFVDAYFTIRLLDEHDDVAFDDSTNVMSPR